MSTKSTEAADAVDRAARGEAAPPTPVRAQRSRGSVPAGDPASGPNDVLETRLRALEHQVGIEGGHRSLLTQAVAKLRAEFNTHEAAVVDQWSELEARVNGIESVHRDTPHAESILREEAMVRRMVDIEDRVEAAEVADPEEVSRSEALAALTAQVDDLHRQVQSLQGQQKVQLVQPATSFWGKRHPRLRLG